ncbi:hypothetical protein H6F98_00900 [Microcoleus sp. FACHB-SPT15]|uniref:hypothetical protein n=1 Tax=Microcoleus sp. FACHB-SPT15 TaxID=2692830 RepID=UPI001786795A|nr:hypothetical protein [Microcoleus sp. FACHB-SPT15]MBD1804032.1 hypothetical protein [Microcoleus sp. FACHB-SPT15]
MTDQAKESQFQIPLSFVYTEGNIPLYVNAVLVNALPEGLLFDLGFLDPLLLSEVQKEWVGKSMEDLKNIDSIPIKSTVRFVINREVAEQLVLQIQAAIGNVKSESP